MSENTSTSTQSRQSCRFWKGFTYLGKLLFTIVAPIGTLLGIWQWYISTNSEPHLLCSVLDNQCLTQIQKVPNLECNLSFAGRRIENLWVSKVQFVNDCRKNIIGKVGGHLMSSNICFTVVEKYHVLMVECEGNDLDVETSCTQNSFALAFEKWKPKQKCIVKVYCEDMGTSNDSVGPTFRKAFEPFTQGDIQIVDYQELLPERSLIKLLPVGLSFVFCWVGIIANGTIFVICLWMLLFGMGWYKMWRRLKWNRQHLNEVMKILQNSNSEDSPDSNNIDALPDEFWQERKIPHPPPPSQLVDGLRINRSELKSSLVVGVVFMLLSGIALLSLIYV